MEITRKSILTFPIEGADGGTVYVHSTPVGRAVFEQFYKVLGHVFTSCFSDEDPRHIALTAPQLALPALKAAAGAQWEPEGRPGVKAGLVNEIIRLTSVAYVDPTGTGWATLPLDIAIKRGIVDDDGEAEILSNLVFFTAISKVAPRTLCASFLEMASSLRDWQFTFSNVTGWISSLPTLTPIENSTIPTSSVIS